MDSQGFTEDSRGFNMGLRYVNPSHNPIRLGGSVGCSPHSCAALHQHPAAKRPGEAAGPILGNEGTDLSDVDRRSGDNGSPPSLRFGTTCAQGTGLPSS